MQQVVAFDAVFLPTTPSRTRAGRPRSFQEQDFEYIDESKGTVESFVGVERILYKGQEIYRLDYHGGAIRTG